MPTVDPTYKESTYVQQLKAFVPTAATALYIAALGLLTVEKEPLAREDYYVRAGVLIVSAVVAAVLVVTTYSLADLRKSAEARKRTAITVPIVVVAFVLYSMATPGGVWQGSVLGVADWSAVGVVLGAILTILFPRIARWVGIEPLDVSTI